MLAYSDNYKHNNLIYFQVVLIDVTTNGSTTLKNPEAGKTCKKQANILSLRPQSSSYTHTGLLGLLWKARQIHCRTEIIRQQNAHEPRILYFFEKMPVPPGGKDDLLLTYEMHYSLKCNQYWCPFNNFLL